MIMFNDYITVAEQVLSALTLFIIHQPHRCIKLIAKVVMYSPFLLAVGDLDPKSIHLNLSIFMLKMGVSFVSIVHTM